jgi:hypothetical protein
MKRSNFPNATLGFIGPVLAQMLAATVAHVWI